MRWLLLVLILLPQMAIADSFDPATTLRIEQALQRLGYVLETPGASLDDNLETVLQYRTDFGMSEDVTLTMAEASELLRRAQMLDEPVALVRGSTQIWPGAPSKWAATESVYVPQSPLFASPRHALAEEMKKLARPYSSADTFDPDLAAWHKQEAERAQRWLADDIRRIEAVDPVGGLMGKTLIELDLRPESLGRVETRDDIQRWVFPRMAILVERFPKAQMSAELYRALNERLLGYLGGALHASNCDPRHRLDRKWTDLSAEIMRRFEEGHPGAPELLGFSKALAQCADDATAVPLHAWRVAAARTLGDAELTVTATLDQAKDAFERGDREGARTALQPLLAAGGLTAQQMQFLPQDMLIELGLGAYIGPMLIAEFEAMRGREVGDNVSLTALMVIVQDLWKLGYGFDVTDRVYWETDTDFRNNGNILEYYRIVTQSMLDRGEGKQALAPLENLVKRAQTSGDIAAAESFAEQQITALLNLGRFSEAEDKIGAFVAMARQGAHDPRVAAWQAQLNHDPREGEAPGIVFAAQMARYLDAMCRRVSPVPETPDIDREAVYADPGFLLSAANLRLSERIATCAGEPYHIKALTRLGCYLWTKEGNTEQLTKAMQKWLIDVRRDDKRGNAIVFDAEYMDCPMGIAEAGGNDLLASFMSQIDNASTETGIVLLKLATLQSPQYAKWVLDQRDSRSGGDDFPFAALAAATQLHDESAAAMRQSGIAKLFIYYSGASADSAEIAEIQSYSLDIAAGYIAMNLDGIAQYFLESAAPEAEIAPDAQQVEFMLANEQSAQYALEMGRISLRRGDSAEAISYVGPLVNAFITRARSNEGKHPVVAAF